MTTKPPFPHSIWLCWSAADEAYVARAVELQDCVAHGDTPLQAVEKVLLAAALSLESTEKQVDVIEVVHFHFASLYPSVRLQVEEVCRSNGFPLTLVDISLTETHALATEYNVRSFPLTKVYRHGRLLGETSVLHVVPGEFQKWLVSVQQTASEPAEPLPQAPHVFASGSLTDEMLMGDTPRCFKDSTLPKPEIEQDFDSYVAWLAEHLFQANLPIPPQYAWMAAKIDEAVSPEAAAGSLGMRAGYFDEGSFSVCHAIREGLSYRECMAKQFADWQQDSDSDLVTLHSYILHPDLYARLEAEERERRNLGVKSDNADIPYRPFLAYVMKKLPDHAGRVSAVRNFFVGYNEAASK